jgi:hypothetical protein
MMKTDGKGLAQPRVKDDPDDDVVTDPKSGGMTHRGTENVDSGGKETPSLRDQKAG